MTITNIHTITDLENLYRVWSSENILVPGFHPTPMKSECLGVTSAWVFFRNTLCGFSKQLQLHRQEYQSYLVLQVWVLNNNVLIQSFDYSGRKLRSVLVSL